ncbi:hypothetical protein POTOM_013147 [Populus tomentosa]|uniref:Uncharacterized protein n=1 Tax=Populus tomentosa TaxID=118781 RepID=A0A8X8A070_POPTO|nr:hypothetical protein POTOM_013147 [Populus tomentosa]
MRERLQGVAGVRVSSLHLPVVFPLSHLLKSVRGKTEKAEVLLYSEKSMRNTQKQRCMNPSPLAARVHWIIVVSRLMPNHRPLCPIPQTFRKLYMRCYRVTEDMTKG